METRTQGYVLVFSYWNDNSNFPKIDQPVVQVRSWYRYKYSIVPQNSIYYLLISLTATASISRYSSFTLIKLPKSQYRERLVTIMYVRVVLPNKNPRHCLQYITNLQEQFTIQY